MGLTVILRLEEERGRHSDERGELADEVEEGETGRKGPTLGRGCTESNQVACGPTRIGTVLCGCTLLRQGLWARREKEAETQLRPRWALGHRSPVCTKGRARARAGPAAESGVRGEKDFWVSLFLK